jgi:AraC family transcriptional regulator, arabinose operon regulatory protein
MGGWNRVLDRRRPLASGDVLKWIDTPATMPEGFIVFSRERNRKLREKHEGFEGQRLVVVPRPILASSLQDPLLKQLLPTDAGYYPKAKGHTCIREKGCPEVIFIYCTDGTGWCEMLGKTHTVSQDQLLVIPASTPHAYGTSQENPWTIHWFHAVGTNVPVDL